MRTAADTAASALARVAIQLLAWAAFVSIAASASEADRGRSALGLVAGSLAIVLVNLVRRAIRTRKPRALVIRLDAERRWRKRGFDLVDDDSILSARRAAVSPEDRISR